MRIINHGDQYELGELVCPNCNCEFAYNQDDVNIIQDHLIIEDENTGNIIRKDLHFVCCPECNTEIELSEDENQE